MTELAWASLAENDAAAALYDDIIRPVEPLLGGTRAAIVVPDRTLAAVPFAALYDRVETVDHLSQHVVDVDLRPAQTLYM